jgi:hypothetical protein
MSAAAIYTRTAFKWDGGNIILKFIRPFIMTANGAGIGGNQDANFGG